MLDAIKVLFVLTGASTYLVTKNLPLHQQLDHNYSLTSDANYSSNHVKWRQLGNGSHEWNYNARQQTILSNKGDIVNNSGSNNKSSQHNVISSEHSSSIKHFSLPPNAASAPSAPANVSNWQQQPSAALLITSFNSSGHTAIGTKQGQMSNDTTSGTLPRSSQSVASSGPQSEASIGWTESAVVLPPRHHFQLSALTRPAEGSVRGSSGRTGSAAVNDLAINFTVTSKASVSSSSAEPSASAHRPSALSSLPPSTSSQPSSSQSGKSHSLLEPNKPQASTEQIQSEPAKSNSPSINNRVLPKFGEETHPQPELRPRWSSSLQSSSYYFLPPVADYYYYDKGNDAKQQMASLNALMTSTTVASTVTTNELTRSTPSTTSTTGKEVKASLTVLLANSVTISSNNVLHNEGDDEDEYEQVEIVDEDESDDDYETNQRTERIDPNMALRQTSTYQSRSERNENEPFNEKNEKKADAPPRQQHHSHRQSVGPADLHTIDRTGSNEKSNQTNTGSTTSPVLRNAKRSRVKPKSKKSVSGKSVANGATASAVAQAPKQQPVYEVLINEEDKDLPKKLFQVKALMINDSRKSSSSSSSTPSSLMFILSGNGVDYEHPEQSKFAINAFTGELFLIAPVDRDPPNGRDVWRLNITAEDERGEKVNGSVVVLVRVRDINDNAPYFEKETFHANVSENLSSGIDIIRLLAVDKDVDSIVRYSIEMNRVNSEGELIFDIDELSGVVSTAVCCLDRESIDQFTIKVCATDQAISGDASFHWSSGKSVAKQSSKVNPTKSPVVPNNQTSCTSVVIDITDDNDEPPRFVRDKYFLQLPDGVNELFPGRVLLNTTITDADLPETNRFACRLSAAIRFPSPNTKVTEVSLKNSSDDNDTSVSSLSGAIFSHPMTIMRKYFQCEVSSNGNVRILITDDSTTYEPEYFYRSLLSEFETYRQSSATTSTIANYVEFLFKITITDIGLFEPTSADDMSVAFESHLTNAELSVKFATVKPLNGMASGNDSIAGLKPSLAVVTKQISPNSYNSEQIGRGGNGDSGGSNNLFAHLRSKWHFWSDRTGAIVLIGSVVAMLVVSTFVLFLLSRYRRGNKRRHRSALSGTGPNSIPGAICCMAVSGTGAHGGSASLPITSDDSNGTNSEHLLPCSSYSSTIDGSDVPTGADHHHLLQQHYQHQSQHHSKLFKPYGQLSEQLSTTTDSLFCHSANSNSNSARTNTGSSILSDNYLIDPYHRTKSPQGIDNSSDASATHLVLLDPSDHHLSQHHHMNNHSANQYSDQLTTYGFEINGPYDTIALYDLTHLQTIPLGQTNHQNESSINKRKSVDIEMSQLRSSNADLASISQVPTSLAIIGLEHNRSAATELGVVLSPSSVAASPLNNAVLPDVISKGQVKGALCETECATTGNFLLIGGSHSHHHLRSSPTRSVNKQVNQ